MRISLILASLLIASCGGGSSSDGAGRQPVADIDKYIGNYSGPVTTSATTSGAVDDSTFTGVLTVRSDGLIVTNQPGAAAFQCDFPPRFLTSNPLSFTQSASGCVYAGSGSTCDVERNGTWTFTGDTIVGTNKGFIECMEGITAFRQTINLTR